MSYIPYGLSKAKPISPLRWQNFGEKQIIYNLFISMLFTLLYCLFSST